MVTVEEVRAALQRPLPGRTAQARMAPVPRPGWEHEQRYQDSCRLAGVLILLYPASSDPAELRLVLTRRAEYPGTHGGQISLPGGGREGNEPLQDTALREAHEEIGVSRQDLAILGRLTPLYIPPSNYCVHPFVAYRPSRPHFHLDSWEVAQVIEMPLGWLFDEQRQLGEFRVHPDRGRLWVPYFEVDGHKVWGATAMVLAELATMLAAKSGVATIASGRLPAG